MTLGRIVDGLSARGHHLEVVCPRRRERAGRLPNPNVRLHEIPGLPIPRYADLRFGLPRRSALIRHWRAQRPDLVHVATEGPLGWSAISAARRLGIPVISTYHTHFNQYGRHYGYGFLSRAVTGWLRHVHNRTLATYVPSETLVHELSLDGFRNVALLSRGVDSERYNPQRRDPALRAEWGAIDDATPVALYVGRVAAEKNIPLTIEAYHAMRATLPDLRMVIVGDGPDRPRLQRAHPDIHFAGMRHGEDLARHYASADCFVFASTTETFGNVVTEAMASGLTVVAYDYAAPARFIEHGHSGFLARFDERADFIATATAAARVRAQWPSIGRAATARVAGISWNHILDRFEQDLLRFHSCKS